MRPSFYPGDPDGGWTPDTSTRFAQIVAIAAIAGAGTAVALLVGVGGDFPLSDDWSYAWATRGLCEQGELRMLPWTGASLVLQAAYGALLCKLFGFSFEVLRMSTIVLAITGAIGFWLLLRALGVYGRPAWLALCVFALCPLYVNLSFTFMTEVPFVVLTVWAAWLYVRGLREDRTALLLAGSALCAAALLVRQHGVFVAGAASLAALIGGVRVFSHRVGRAMAAGAVPALAFLAYLVWLFGVRGAPPAVENKMAEAAGATLAGTINVAFRSLEYIGLLLAPLAVAVASSVVRQAPRRLALVGFLLAGCVVALFARERALMFYLTNVVYDLGVGALTLRDVLFLDMDPPLHVGTPLAAGLTLVSTASAAVVVVALWHARPSYRDSARTFIWLSASFLLAASYLHARFYFDRYLLPVVPFAAAAVAASRLPFRASALAWTLAAVLGWYAVAGTHDYLAWNRVRFAMLDALEREGEKPQTIDGGVEYNAWRLAGSLGTWPTTQEAQRGQPASRKSWWWVVDDRFVVTFRPLAGYTVRERRPYSRWLIPGRGEVLLLSRSADARAQK